MVKRILLVDDADFIRNVCKEVLQEGYEIVSEASNGADGVNKYMALKPDVVIMDISMPGMDGITALGKIRSFDPNANVVMLSSIGTAYMVAEAILSGARSFLVKPFQSETLIKVIEECFLPPKLINYDYLMKVRKDNARSHHVFLSQTEINELLGNAYKKKSVKVTTPNAYSNKEIDEMLACVDHTLLNVAATTSDYITLCQEGMEYHVASLCVPPSRVSLCAGHVNNTVAIGTVVGFPNGYTDSSIKAQEAALAIQHGASEIDMVVNIGMVREKDFNAVFSDIRQVRAATEGFVLKVIIESSILTHDEKLALCQVVGTSGADYIKTSTGFSSGGATFDDVTLLRKNVPSNVKVKASGGIETLDDAFQFIKLGADRLGTSRIIKIIQGMNADGY